MAELLPCPFCGGAARGPQFVTGMRFDWYCGCDTCKIYVYVPATPNRKMAIDSAQQESVEAWNRRAPPIDASRAEDAWISVEERLPPKIEDRDFSNDVLIAQPTNAPNRSHYVRVSHCNWFPHSEVAWTGATPTHWMPLPAPPARALATDGDDRG